MEEHHYTIALDERKLFLEQVCAKCNNKKIYWQPNFVLLTNKYKVHIKLIPVRMTTKFALEKAEKA